MTREERDSLQLGNRVKYLEDGTIGTVEAFNARKLPVVGWLDGCSATTLTLCVLKHFEKVS
jgi:hypothetical protein